MEIQLKNEWDLQKQSLCGVKNCEYYCLIDINNIITYIYYAIYINNVNTMLPAIQQLIDKIIQILDGRYYNLSWKLVYYLPYILRIIPDSNSRHLVSQSITVPEMKNIGGIDANFISTIRKVKNERVKQGKDVSYNISEIIAYLDNLFATPLDDIHNKIRDFNFLAISNEQENYFIRKAQFNIPKTELLKTLFETLLTGTVITSNPTLPLKEIVLTKKHCINVTYVNLLFTEHMIRYPRISGLNTFRVNHDINFLGGINEINKSDIAKYFPSISPMYIMIDMKDFDLTKDGWIHLFVDVCNRVANINANGKVEAGAIKYYNGMWGLGTTFLILPKPEEWAYIYKHITSPQQDSSIINQLLHDYSFFLNNIANFITECLILLWYNKSDFGHILQLMNKTTGINRLEVVYAQIVEDIKADRVSKTYNKNKSILTPIPSIKILFLQIIISSKCQVFTEVCANGKNLFDEMIGEILNEKVKDVCHGRLLKGKYYDMLSSYIQEITKDKFCLQYFNFKTRLFPVFYIDGKTISMFLPQYARNEWMIPFNIDTLFIQYQNDNGECHVLSDSRFVSNKQMSDQRMTSISYDVSPLGERSQCECNARFFDNKNDDNIKTFVRRFLIGYVNMMKEKPKLIKKGIFMTTFDVIVNGKNELVLLDINNGGNYGISQPSKFMIEIHKHIITNPRFLESIQEDNVIRMQTLPNLYMCNMDAFYCNKIKY